MKFFLILMLCLSSWTGAEVYQWLDEKGGEHFSDRPYPQAKKLDIKPGYGFYKVKAVYDGDTVVLEDGRKVRLLGINAPEVKHRNKIADAGGEEARLWLMNRLQHAKVRMEIDVEKTDKYGRTLAYLFTEQKEHINLSLVKAGLAAVNIYPPNLLYADELIKSEKQAEKARLGIWQRHEYAAVPAGSLTEAGHPGWTRLTGRVIHIHHSRKYIYLEMTGQVDARIERKWLFLFPDVNDYLGKTVEIRGWLNKSKSHFSLLVRHPSAISQKDNT
ncbi:MAG: thermonuclease family protein [Methylococcales bacterium]|nr:thermonuclease family protein [Methylococcales bacterium]